MFILNLSKWYNWHSRWCSVTQFAGQPLGFSKGPEYSTEPDATADGRINRRLLVRNVGNTASTAPILLGLMNFFMRKLPKTDVGYFNPVAAPPYFDGMSRHIHLLKSVCKLPEDASSMFAIKEEEAFQVCLCNYSKEGWHETLRNSPIQSLNTSKANTCRSCAVPTMC